MSRKRRRYMGRHQISSYSDSAAMWTKEYTDSCNESALRLALHASHVYNTVIELICL